MAKSVKEHFNLGSARGLMDELILEIADLRTKLAAAVVDLTNNRVTTAALVVDVAALRIDNAESKVDLDAAKAIYDAHTHTCAGNGSRSSLPDTGTPTGNPSAASAFTITQSAVAAVTSTTPSAITATAPSAATVTS